MSCFTFTFKRCKMQPIPATYYTNLLPQIKVKEPISASCQHNTSLHQGFRDGDENERLENCANYW